MLICKQFGVFAGHFAHAGDRCSKRPLPGSPNDSNGRGAARSISSQLIVRN
jgi:hypothetical protein